MNPTQAYRSTYGAGLTRVDLLLELYERALNHVKQSLEIIRNNHEGDADVHLFRACRIVAGLKQGLDLSYGEIPENLDRLFDFALRGLLGGDSKDIAAAYSVLKTLESAYQQIRSEAVQLEKSGRISRPHVQQVTQTLA